MKKTFPTLERVLELQRRYNKIEIELFRATVKVIEYYINEVSDIYYVPFDTDTSDVKTIYKDSRTNEILCDGFIRQRSTLYEVEVNTLADIATEMITTNYKLKFKQYV